MSIIELIKANINNYKGNIKGHTSSHINGKSQAIVLHIFVFKGESPTSAVKAQVGLIVYISISITEHISMTINKKKAD